ncbi:MAG TPA: hypothetical protein VH541_05915 [Gaiellaceae bacterium]
MLVALLALALASGVGGWLAARSSGGVTGLCAFARAGLRERTFSKTRTYEATVVLTNFRFGGVDDFYGIGAAAGRDWPRHGITVAVINEGPDSSPPLRSALRVSGADFRGFEGSRWPVAHLAIRSQGRVLEAYAEARTVTPAVVTTVNRALAEVRLCRTSS